MRSVIKLSSQLCFIKDAQLGQPSMVSLVKQQWAHKIHAEMIWIWARPLKQQHLTTSCVQSLTSQPISYCHGGPKAIRHQESGFPTIQKMQALQWPRQKPQFERQKTALGPKPSKNELWHWSDSNYGVRFQGPGQMAITIKRIRTNIMDLAEAVTAWIWSSSGHHSGAIRPSLRLWDQGAEPTRRIQCHPLLSPIVFLSHKANPTAMPFFQTCEREPGWRALLLYPPLPMPSLGVTSKAQAKALNLAIRSLKAARSFWGGLPFHQA